MECIEKYRDYNKENAIECAIKECIRNGVLREYLERKGKQSGQEIKLISMVCKKLAKHQSISQIAEALEEGETEIQRICAIADKYAPTYDVDQIYKEYRIGSQGDEQQK